MFPHLLGFSYNLPLMNKFLVTCAKHMNTIDTNSLRAALQYKDRDKLKEVIGQKNLRVYDGILYNVAFEKEIKKT